MAGRFDFSPWRRTRNAHPVYQAGVFASIAGLITFGVGVVFCFEAVVLISLFAGGVLPPLFYACLRLFFVEDDDRDGAKKAGEMWGPFWIAMTAFGVLLYQYRFPDCS